MKEENIQKFSSNNNLWFKQNWDVCGNRRVKKSFCRHSRHGKVSREYGSSKLL